MEERLQALETRIAYQDRTIAALDEVLREFAARVERLERRLTALEQLPRSEEDVGPHDEPPPHY